MQRQSLGSPVSKLHSHGCGGASKDDNLISDDPKRRDLPSIPLPNFDAIDAGAADDDYCKSMKKQQPRRFSSSPSSSFSSSPPKPEKLVHFIPLLTLLCFLILYSVSHAPSPTDLAQFKRFSKHIDSSEIRDDEALNELSRGDVLAIRSLRNLQEIAVVKTGNRKSHQLHRKIAADF